MRILLTTDVVGGVWRYTVTLTRRLAARGHTCAVAVLGEAAESRLSQLPPSVDTFQRPTRLEWMPGGLEDLDPTTNWLVSVAMDWQPDVVHLNQFGYAAGAYPAPVVVVAHSDVLSWFEETRGTPAPSEWAAYQEAVRAGMESADVVVAPTGYQSGRLARHYGRTAVRVIHNGTEPPPKPPARPASERSLILVAGRAWDEAKGIALLDRAVAELGPGAPTVHLVGPTHGPGGERVEIEHLIEHGEVDGPTMGRFYGNAKLYVAPSLYEPFGLSPLEAAGHGCALLLSGIGSFRELWAGAAAYFDPLYPDALAARLRAVLNDPAALDQLADAAHRRARERFTARRMADQYLALYRSLAPGAADDQAGAEDAAVPASDPLHTTP